MRGTWKRKGLAALGLALTLAVVGCGSGSAGSTGSYSVEESAYDAAAYDDGAVSSGESASAITSDNGIDAVTDTGRKLIKNVNLQLQTREFDAVLEGLAEKVSELGGYVEDSSVWGSSYEYSSSRSASYTVRVPSDRLDEFVEVVSELGNVSYKNESVDDVTLQYVDVESRRNALETEQDRLMELLEEAGTVEDIITIESRLSEVRYELENYESQIRLLDNQIEYSAVYLDITEVDRVTETGEKGFWDEVSSRFGDSLYRVAMGFRSLAVGILGSLPILAVWAAVIAVIVLILRKLGFKRIRKKKDEKES